MTSGKNTLAVQGLNHETIDGDFLLGVSLTGQPQSQGDVASTAQLYQIPITLPISTHLKARIFNGSWSALNEATFAVGPVAPSLEVTELMYHPLSNQTPSQADTEYIELQNTGSDPINLAHVTLSGGVRFTFPARDLAPDEYVLVVKDRQAFESGYGTDLDGLPRLIDGDQDGSVVQDIGPYEYDPSHPLMVVSQPGLVFIRDVNAPNPENQPLAFRNTTPAPSDWTLTSDTSWLTASQDSGRLVNDRTSVSVSVASEGMSRSVYSGMLTLSDPNAVNSPVQIPVTLKIRGTLSVPGQFATILEAVNDAMEGEIIEVNGGEYTEGVTLDKPLTLIGRNDPNIASYYSSGIQITADNCLVQGFDISGTNYGLRISGSHNTVKNLSISNANVGVYLSSGTDNTLDQIAISNSSDTGLNIQHSPQNTLTNITIKGAPRGFSLTGNNQDDYQQSIDETNTVDGKPILYLVGESDRVIAPNLVTPACVYLVDCTDIVLFRLTLSGFCRGGCLVNSSNNNTAERCYL